METQENEVVTRFIGDKEVVAIEETPDSTPLNAIITKVTFADGSTKRYPKKVVDLIISSSASNATVVRNQKINPLVSELLALMAEYDLAVEEIDSVINLLTMSINENLKQAECKMWKVQEPGMKTLLDVDAVLKS